jgi:hypothetical protein
VCQFLPPSERTAHACTFDNGSILQERTERSSTKASMDIAVDADQQESADVAAKA